MQCNCCSSRDFEVLFSNYKSPNIRFADHPSNVLICRNCGLVCLDIGNLTEEQLRDYYSTFSHFEKPGALYEGHRPLREGQVRWVLDHLPAGHGIETVLDVGCGAGYVLKLFRDHGFQVWGIDYSPVMIKNLKELYGIDGYVGAFHPAAIERTYDLITCIKVMEHLFNPDEVIRGFCEALNEGGFAYIEVPDSEHPRWDMLPDYFVFDHLYHFTERTLGRILEKNGLEVVAVDHIDNPGDSGNPGWALRVLARKTKPLMNKYRHVNDYRKQKAVMREYRRRHDAYLGGFGNKLAEIKRKVGNEKMAIYCAGEHTSMLLDRFDFSGFDILCIYDGDPAITGGRIGDLTVRHSSDTRRKEVKHYLLSTTNHEKEICKFLKQIDPDCRVYGLYADFD